MASVGEDHDLPEWAIYIITEWRAVIIVCVVMPLSFMSRLFNSVRRSLFEAHGNDAAGHDQRVEKVQAEVRRWAELPEARRKRLCTDRSPSASHSVRFAPKHLWHRIGLGSLRHILSLDEERRLVRVEPGVTMGHVMRYLASKGFMLEVTLEMEDATVGGLVMATG